MLHLLFVLALINYETNEEREEKEEVKNEQDKLNGKCCKCESSKEDLELLARERSMQIRFENYLHNNVYVKR